MREVHLRDFIAVADAGSVRGAARRLNLSQGAVSKNLLALERECGVVLLVRTAHGVEPTEFGRILLRRARLAEGELRKAKEEIAELTGHPHGSLSVGMSATGEATLLVAATQRFRKEYPDTLVNIRGGTTFTLAGLLREGKIDLAVAPMAKSSLGPDIHAERLLKTELVVLARAGHPCANATDLSELAGCEWIHGARPDELDPIIVEAFRKANLAAPRFVAQWDSFSAMAFLLLQSDYVSLASGPAAEPFCRDGLLAKIPLHTSLGPSTQLLLTPANRPLTPHAKLYAAELLKAARAPKRR